MVPTKPGISDTGIRSSSEGGPGTNILLSVSAAASRNPISIPKTYRKHHDAVAVGELLRKS